MTKHKYFSNQKFYLNLNAILFTFLDTLKKQKIDIAKKFLWF